MEANKQQIIWLLENVTPYRIAKETGIPRGNLYYLKKGKIKIDNLTFKTASALTELAKKMQKRRGINGRSHKNG